MFCVSGITTSVAIRSFLVRQKKTINRILIATVLAYSGSSYATTNISPIVALLLLDERPILAPYRWNGQLLDSTDSPSVDEGSINTLGFDTSNLPADLYANLQTLSINMEGACYQIGGETLDPQLYEWSVVTTGSGVCTVTLSFSAEIDGQIVSEFLDIRIGMNATTSPSPSMESLVAQADTSEGDAKIAGVFSFSNIQAWLAPAMALQQGGVATALATSVFPDSFSPSLYEFDAVHQGVALKGVMLSTRKTLDPRSLSAFDMEARTSVRFVQGIPVLVGSGVVSGAQDKPDNTFAFVAVKAGVSLPGPVPGSEYHIDGKNELNVLCADQRLAGFGNFRARRTGTRIASSLVGFTSKDCSGSGGRFKGTSGVFSDFQVINTHIGKVLRGRGTAHPLHNGSITTIEDMDPNDPAYALYMLGVAERLSTLHAITAVDAGSSYRSGVYILDPFDLAKIARIRRNNGTLIFSDPPASLLGISVGDIIVGKPTARLRDGFLREVTAKGTNNGEFYLQTRPARLDQLFETGGMTFNKSLKLGDVEQSVIPQYGFRALPRPQSSNNAVPVVAAAKRSNTEIAAAARAPIENPTVAQATLDVLPFPDVNFDHVFIDADGNENTTTDQFRTEGLFKLDAELTFDFKCHGLLCSNPDLLLRFDFYEDFELSGYAYTDQYRAIYDSAVLKSLEFGGFWIGPVKIKPQINLIVQMLGSTDTDIKWGIDQYFNSGVGVELSNGNWTTIKERDDGLIAAPTPDYLAGDGDADLRARAALQGEIKISGISVGGADVGIYTDVEASTPRDPRWSVLAGINSEAYVEIDLLLATVNGGPWTLFDIPFTVPGGDAPDIPPAINWIKVDSIKVENGSVHSNVAVASLDGFAASPTDLLRIKVNAFDPDIGYDCCNVRVTSSIDGQIGLKGPADLSTYNNYVFPMDAFSSGIHTITVKVWEAGKPESTAIVETFTMRGRQDFVFQGCQTLEVSSDIATGVAPQYVNYTAQLSDGCSGAGHEIEWLEVNAFTGAYSAPFSTDVTGFAGVGSPPAPVTEGWYYPDPTARTIVARHLNNAGVWIYSNRVGVVISDTSQPVSGFGALSGSPIANALSSRVLSAVSGGVQPPLLAPSNTTPHRLTLNNWSVGEMASFQNPFPSLAGYTVSWEMTDPAAVITVTAAGHAQVTPAAAGWHKLRAINTHDASGRQTVNSETFYVTPGNDKTWRGYRQQDYSLDASHLLPETGL